MQRDEFKQYFQSYFTKLGITEQRIERDQKRLEEIKKEDNKWSFALLCVICIGVSYFISLKFQ